MRINNLFLSSILVILFLSTGSIQGQELKTIKGKITYKDQPLPNVHVVNSDSKMSVKSDTKGQYQIQARVGEELSFSFVGLKNIKVIIEDVTTTLNMKMADKVNELETVVVKANKKPGRSQRTAAKKIKRIKTAVGEINLKAYGARVYYANGEDLNQAAFDPAIAIASKFADVQANGSGGLFVMKNYARPDKAVWDIDGALFDDAPNWLTVLDIREVYILLSAGAKYGKYAAVIVITKSNPQYIEEKKEEVSEQYRNQNFYDETSVTTELDFSKSDIPMNQGAEKEIFGKITHLESPVPDVMVSVAGKKELRVFTDQQGKYQLKVRVGDIIQFSHVSFETMSIYVEDITEELNVSLEQKVTELEEVAVKTNNQPKVLVEKRKKIEEEYYTSRGNENAKASGFSQNYIDGSGMTNVYVNIQEALIGKIPGYTYEQVSGRAYLRGKNMSINQTYPVAWEVDGVFTTEAPIVDMNQIKSVRAIRAMGASNKYGSQAPGGVIIITTINGNFMPKKSKKETFKEEYANSNFYQDDASVSTLEIKEQNKFSDAMELYGNKEKAFDYYNKVLKNKITNYGDHISVALKFIEFYNDQTMALKILNEQALKNSRNPEILKTLAYYYEWLGNKRSAITTYERIYEIRPQHAQSFRDLANAYVNYDLYDKAWKLYYSYYLKGRVISSEGIGELIYSEMEWLYYLRKNQTKIKQNFTPLNKTVEEFQKDVRMVFEWNTSEAEFDLEFVSPDRRAYVFDHSLSANNSLIIDEKQVGYSSKLFFIEELGDGKWLVNLTYKGNKKALPSFMKVTTYYNWGKPNEKKKVDVYKLEIQNQKASLLNFDSEYRVFQLAKK